MTVQKLYAKNIYKGNGSNKSFPFTFECPENHPEFVRVFVRENYLNETTNFAIDMQNRIVTYPVDGDALPEGANIIITRELPLTQVMNLINNGPFFAEDIETSLDEIVMMIQQLNEKADRSLTVEVDSTENPNDVIGQIFDARNLTQELAEEAAANAAASLQSEQNAKASETISSRNKTVTDENRSSVENAKSQVDTLLSQVIEHEANALTYKNDAKASAAQASEYEESARANAASANGSASLASQKATEVIGVNQQIYIDRDAALTAIATDKTNALNAIDSNKSTALSDLNTAKTNAIDEVQAAISDVTSDRARAETAANHAQEYKDLAYQYMQGSVNIPVGTPLLWFWGEDTIPVGFIRYTTSSLSATAYPDLFALCQHKYGGSGDEFYLPPDLYGRFMEISDVGGVYHEAGLPNITGTLGGLLRDESRTSIGALVGRSSSGTATGGSAKGFSGFEIDASLSNEIYGKSDTVQPKSITAILIIKAFAGANPKATDLEITRVANDLLTFKDTTDYIVDSGKSTDGTIWYRKWKSGWLEQGGITPNINTPTITLPMNFKDSDYQVVVSPRAKTFSYIATYDKTVNQFTLRVGNSSTTATNVLCDFYACGQGGEEQ